MLRPVSNPPNPYQAARSEWWWEPPPPAEVQVFEDLTKGILSENDSPDLSFRWSINPYRGCQHACAYCYARPSHERWGFGAGTDFETKLMVKPRAPELLREAFLKPSWQGELVVVSGNTDCYQPLEGRWQLTRKCLEVFRDFRNPVGIITKSPLILRDLDLLKELAYIHIVVSIAFSDDEVARKVDAGAPSIRRRFQTVKALADAGLFVTVSAAPLIPGLNDEMGPAILKEAKANGARSAFTCPVRLSGNLAPVFLARIREAFPDRADKVEHWIREMRGGAISDSRFGKRYEGQGARWELALDQFRLWRRRLGLDQDHPMLAQPTFRRPGPCQAGFGF